jgi:glutamine amidotransferase
MEASVYGQLNYKAPITIVDYGMGNLWSVKNAFLFLGVESQFGNTPKQIRDAQSLVLPGVGSFRKAMERLRTSGLKEALREAVLNRKKKILGICLGMQLMAEKGFEDGESEGLALLPGTVERFTKDELGCLKLPHIGFNKVAVAAEGILFRGLSPAADFYFAHSYRLLPIMDGGGSHQALCRYGVNFLAAYESENVFGVQFHPEKSQTNGLRLIKNFLIA